jgi:lincosamide nucleotidyltransferase A/C/D/E
MVSAEDVISILQNLSANDIQVWLTGGWGIDALLREETRHHKDLDFIMLVDDVVRMRDRLTLDGYGLKELWSENIWVVDSNGAEVPTAFVLQDSEGREVDVHAMHLDDHSNGIPAWSHDGLIFKKEDLAVEGFVSGFSVPCISSEMQVLSHKGYDLPKEQLRDLELLLERFGVEYTDEH